MFVRKPIGGPLPDVSDHVGEPVAIWRIRTHRGGALVTAGRQVFVRKRTLPSVCHSTPHRYQLVAPGELSIDKASTGRELPFGFGRQLFSRPARISFRIRKSDVDDGMVVKPFERASRAIGLRQLALNLNVHQWEKSPRSTGCEGGLKVIEPG